MSVFNEMTASETMDLHGELSDFIDKYVATMPNNSGAKIFQYEKCDARGTFYDCPVKGCNNTDFFECNKLLERKYGKGARLKPEPAADGSGFYVRLMIPIHDWHKKRGVGGRGRNTNGPPAFQTLVTLMLTDVVLVGALYWKVFL